MHALVLWDGEKKTSILPISVINQNDCHEGCVTVVACNGVPYCCRILKIRSTQRELKEFEAELHQNFEKDDEVAQSSARSVRSSKMSASVVGQKATARQVSKALGEKPKLSTRLEAVKKSQKLNSKPTKSRTQAKRALDSNVAQHSKVLQSKKNEIIDDEDNEDSDSEVHDAETYVRSPASKKLKESEQRLDQELSKGQPRKFSTEFALNAAFKKSWSKSMQVDATDAPEFESESVHGVGTYVKSPGKRLQESKQRERELLKGQPKKFSTYVATPKSASKTNTAHETSSASESKHPEAHVRGDKRNMDALESDGESSSHGNSFVSDEDKEAHNIPEAAPPNAGFETLKALYTPSARAFLAQLLKCLNDNSASGCSIEPSVYVDPNIVPDGVKKTLLNMKHPGVYIPVLEKANVILQARKGPANLIGALLNVMFGKEKMKQIRGVDKSIRENVWKAMLAMVNKYTTPSDRILDTEFKKIVNKKTNDARRNRTPTQLKSHPLPRSPKSKEKSSENLHSNSAAARPWIEKTVMSGQGAEPRIRHTEAGHQHLWSPQFSQQNNASGSNVAEAFHHAPNEAAGPWTEHAVTHGQIAGPSNRNFEAPSYSTPHISQNDPSGSRVPEGFNYAPYQDAAFNQKPWLINDGWSQDPSQSMGSSKLLDLDSNSIVTNAVKRSLTFM